MDMCVITDGSELNLPDNAVLISDNKISQVWRVGLQIYKRSTPYLTNNEWYFLSKMYKLDRSPQCWLSDKYTIGMWYFEDTPVTNKEELYAEIPRVLADLKKAGIRHGDLTRPALRIRNNRIYLIDFAESRHWDDPIIDKRPEGDRYWLTKTIKEIIDAGLS